MWLRPVGSYAARIGWGTAPSAWHQVAFTVIRWIRGLLLAFGGQHGRTDHRAWSPRSRRHCVRVERSSDPAVRAGCRLPARPGPGTAPGTWPDHDRADRGPPAEGQRPDRDDAGA